MSQTESGPKKFIPDLAENSFNFDLLLTLAASVFIYCFVFKFPFTPLYYPMDQQFFAYDAWRMYTGDVLYKDFFQFTFPGTQLVYLTLFELFGLRYWVLNVVIVAAGAALFWTTLRVSRHVIQGPLYLLPAVILIFFGFRWLGIDGTHRMISPIFIMLALLAILKGTDPVNMLSAGVMCALTSFFTQQRGVIVGAAIVLFVLADKLKRGEDWKSVVKANVYFGVAFTVVIIVSCAPFAYMSSLSTFVYSTFEYPAKYYANADVNSYSIYLIDLKRSFQISRASGVLALLPSLFYSLVTPLVYVGFAVFYAVTRKDHQWEYWRIPLLFAVVGGLLTITTVGPNQYRFFQIAAPMLVLLIWLASQVSYVARHARLASGGVIAVLMIIGVAQAVHIQTGWDFAYIDTPTGRVAGWRSNELDPYIFLSENTKAGDYFLEAPGPIKYFSLQLRNPTRISQIWPTDYTRPEQIAEVVRDLEERPPRYILLPIVYETADGQMAPDNHLSPLMDYVKANYIMGKIYDPDGHPCRMWERRSL